LRVTETFTSIQGESTFTGCLCFFIRLAGCNLDCSYCDTEYSKDYNDGEDFEPDDLIREVEDSQIGLVEITGGEPLLQPMVPELCRRLLATRKTVLIETNGSLPISVLPPGVIRILDCKTPSSGMAGKMNFDNFTELTDRDEVKFVIADFADYEYSLNIIDKYKLSDKTEKLLFSPIWKQISPIQLAERMIGDKVSARLQIQLHKYIWGPDKKRV